MNKTGQLLEHIKTCVESIDYKGANLNCDINFTKEVAPFRTTTVVVEQESTAFSLFGDSVDRGIADVEMELVFYVASDKDEQGVADTYTCMNTVYTALCVDNSIQSFCNVENYIKIKNSSLSRTSQEINKKPFIITPMSLSFRYEVK